MAPRRKRPAGDCRSRPRPVRPARSGGSPPRPPRRHRRLHRAARTRGSRRSAAKRVVTTRRSRGEGDLHWDETRQRWIATATLGFDGRGKRITPQGQRQDQHRSQGQAAGDPARARGRCHANRAALLRRGRRALLADLRPCGRRSDHGAELHQHRGTARDPEARCSATREARRTGRGRLGAGTLAGPVDAHAAARPLDPQPGGQARDGARSRPPQRRGTVRDPRWQEGRRSKSLTLDQADKVLTAAGSSDLHAYVVLSLLIGARTEELRALRWAAVDLDGRPDATPPIPPSISVLRSVRRAGDTKTTQVATSARSAAALCPGPPRTSGQARSPTRRG